MNHSLPSVLGGTEFGPACGLAWRSWHECGSMVRLSSGSHCLRRSYIPNQYINLLFTKNLFFNSWPLNIDVSMSWYIDFIFGPSHPGWPSIKCNPPKLPKVYHLSNKQLNCPQNVFLLYHEICKITAINRILLIITIPLVLWVIWKWCYFILQVFSVLIKKPPR